MDSVKENKDSEVISKGLSFSTMFIILLVVNMIAVNVNHIDDTDETYGYWEPLHYLLFGRGMQTWEYAPEFAIRTYAFITPFWVLSVVLSFFCTHKITLFYAIRSILGIWNAYVTSNFISSLHSVFGSRISIVTFFFMLTSPGIFYTSTALLPSAVTMTVTMLAVTSWLDNHYLWCLFYGCVAVLWSGWPFVGVILVPLGVHMLVSSYARRGVVGVFSICLGGAVILAGVGFPPVVIDSWLYGRITSPSVNILLYNAIGGSGDELYGVEPASYYTRNLVLTLGLCFPLSLSSVQAMYSCARNYFFISAETESKKRARDRVGRLATLLSCAIIWTGVLFSRPHKEERFMYPAYPLICFTGAVGLDELLFCMETVLTVLVSAGITDRQKSAAMVWNLVHVVMMLTVLVSGVIGGCRIASNYKNYHGVIELWSGVNKAFSPTQSPSTPLFVNILRDSPVIQYLSKSNYQHLPQSDDQSTKLTICTAGEWYLFPSHFFLPDHVQLGYIEGTFHGLLPRYFPVTESHLIKDHATNEREVVLGTALATGSDFNGLNAEVRSRYINVRDCDALVLIVNASFAQDLHDAAVTEDRELFGLVKWLDKPILDPANSLYSLARAFYIPHYSAKKNVFRKYALFKWK